MGNFPFSHMVTDLHVDAVSFDGMLETLLLTGEFYYGRTHSQGDFVLAMPDSGQDSVNGGRCAQTGYWTAAHDLVTVDGLQFASAYAPDTVNKD